MTTKLFGLLLSILTISSSIFAQSFLSNDTFENKVNFDQLSSGTIVSVKIDSEISSANSTVNDTFTVTLIDNFEVNGVLILPAKTVFQGRITNVEKSARGTKPGTLEFVFDRIKFLDGTTREIKAELVDVAGKSEILKGKSATVGNVLLIGGGIGIGVALGGISGGNKPIVGGLIGAGIGISSVFLRKGNEAVLKANSKLRIRIKETVVLPVKDF